MFPSRKNIDYFVLVNGRTDDNYKLNIVSTIKQIPNVLTAFEIEITGTRDMDNFLSDLELHMLERKKDK
ncbi:MAG: hypothetical protein K8R68_12480 [Bacteroidales bacterium]|nr:hypothetical protein [Bacteroidales bacterium]